MFIYIASAQEGIKISPSQEMQNFLYNLNIILKDGYNLYNYKDRVQKIMQFYIYMKHFGKSIIINKDSQPPQSIEKFIFIDFIDPQTIDTFFWLANKNIDYENMPLTKNMINEIKSYIYNMLKSDYTHIEIRELVDTEILNMNMGINNQPFAIGYMDNIDILEIDRCINLEAIANHFREEGYKSSLLNIFFQPDADSHITNKIVEEFDKKNVYKSIQYDSKEDIFTFEENGNINNLQEYLRNEYLKAEGPSNALNLKAPIDQAKALNPNPDTVIPHTDLADTENPNPDASKKTILE
jgi:hypothetical protein